MSTSREAPKQSKYITLYLVSEFAPCLKYNRPTLCNSARTDIKSGALCIPNVLPASDALRQLIIMLLCFVVFVVFSTVVLWHACLKHEQADATSLRVILAFSHLKFGGALARRTVWLDCWQDLTWITCLYCASNSGAIFAHNHAGPIDHQTCVHVRYGHLC